MVELFFDYIEKIEILASGGLFGWILGMHKVP
jgi:hypothetical protein